MNPHSHKLYTLTGLLNYLLAPAMLGVWAGTGMVVGAGLSLYGANKQAKAAQDAANKNKEAVDSTNALNWSQYLMSRGINPGGQTLTPGVIPTSGVTAMNSRLPLWATIKTSAANGMGKRGFRIRGTGGPGVTPAGNSYVTSGVQRGDVPSLSGPPSQLL